MNVVKQQASAVSPSGVPSPAGRALDGRYRLEGEIGSGGLGAVYRATHEKLAKPVAIKLLHAHRDGDAIARGRFEREAKALAALSHPNVVSVLDFGVEGEQPYLVMELLEGETLAERLLRGPLDEPTACDLTVSLLSALAYVHEAGLVHRDIKPGNVFLQDKREAAPRLKLLDFGLAKSLESDAPDALLTRSGSVVGTPAYMSPEQASGEAADTRSDVYAAGVMILEMLAGRTPFAGDAIEQLRGHLLSAIPSLHELHPRRRATPEFDAFIARALAKRRQDRYENAKQMLDALGALPRPWFLEEVQQLAPANDVAPDAPTVNVATDSAAPPTPKSSEQRAGGRVLRWLMLLVLLSGAAYYAQRGGVLQQLGHAGHAALSSHGRELDHASAPTQPMAAEPAPEIPQAPVQPLAAAAAAVDPQPPEPAAQAPAPAALPTATDAPPEADDALDKEDAPPAHAEPIESERDELPPALPPPVVKPRSPARNPWSRGVPKDLRPARAAAQSGQRGNDHVIANVRRYNREHPTDVRGHLVLAQLYKNREWCSDAMGQYRIAYQLEPSSRGAPETLPALLQMVAHGCASGSAARFIDLAYRGDALGATQRALKTYKNDARALARLTNLRARLTSKK